MIDPKLLELLVCPMGKAPLQLEGNQLICTRCGSKFNFTREGYPNLVIEDAELPAGCQRVEDLPCAKDGAAYVPQ
jgi:uncharacterized protein YbaR (Trm112 family)